MTDIVEAMARAMIWTKLTDLARVECKWPDDFGDDECAAYRCMARAALTAALDYMREPSEAQCEVLWGKEAKDQYRQAINVAIEELSNDRS